MVEARFVVCLERLECKEFVVEMRWYNMEIVIFVRCVGTLVKRMRIFEIEIVIRKFNFFV